MHPTAFDESIAGGGGNTVAVTDSNPPTDNRTTARAPRPTSSLLIKKTTRRHRGEALAMSDSGEGEGWTRVEQEVLDEDQPPVDAPVAGLYSPTGVNSLRSATYMNIA